jgi:hypothetical protein
MCVLLTNVRTHCIHNSSICIRRSFGDYVAIIMEYNGRIFTLYVYKNKRTSVKYFFFFQWHYSPGRASASLKSFLHPSRFRATIVQFLHPNLAASSSTPSSQRNLGLPLGRFPPGLLRRTLLDKFSSS